MSRSSPRPELHRLEAQLEQQVDDLVVENFENLNLFDEDEVVESAGICDDDHSGRGFEVGAGWDLFEAAMSC
jgi:hypothetical protein